MNKKIFFIGSFIIGMIIFLGVIGGIGWDSISQDFSKLSLKYLWYFLLVSLGILIGKTYKWYIILKSHGVKMGFFRLVMCKLSGIAISFITPVAMMGGGFAMGYLLVKEGVEGHKAVSSVVLDKSFEIVMSLLFTLFGLIVIFATSAISGNLILIFLVISLIFMLVTFLLYDRVRKKKSIFTGITKITRLDKVKWFAKYNTVLYKSEKNVSDFLVQNEKESVKALIITALTWTLMIFEYKFILLAMGIHASLAFILASIAVVGIAYSAPVPAALGALEGGQASLFASFGFQASAGFVLGMIIRMRDILWTILGFIYLIMKGLGLAKNI